MVKDQAHSRVFSLAILAPWRFETPGVNFRMGCARLRRMGATVDIER